MTDFRLPYLSERLAVIGRTGSGKTQAGLWAASNFAFDDQPLVLVDYKLDGMIANIPRTNEIDFNTVPKHPGIYILRPDPSGDEDEMEKWLWKIHSHENIGLFFDEAYEVPDKRAFSAILRQGRSKHIPVISCTQRPSWINRFIFSEADHFMIFHLNDKKDRARVKEFIPDVDMETRLEEFHSRWYNVKADKLFNLLPVPSADDILTVFDERLKPRRRLIG